MARCYHVTAVVPGETEDDPDTPISRFGGSQSEAADIKRSWLEKHSLKRAQVRTDPVDIPTKKDELVNWLNEKFGDPV